MSSCACSLLSFNFLRFLLLFFLSRRCYVFGRKKCCRGRGLAMGRPCDVRLTLKRRLLKSAADFEDPLDRASLLKFESLRSQGAVDSPFVFFVPFSFLLLSSFFCFFDIRASKYPGRHDRIRTSATLVVLTQHAVDTHVSFPVAAYRNRRMNCFYGENKRKATFYEISYSLSAIFCECLIENLVTVVWTTVIWNRECHLKPMGTNSYVKSFLSLVVQSEDKKNVIQKFFVNAIVKFPSEILK